MDNLLALSYYTKSNHRKGQEDLVCMPLVRKKTNHSFLLYSSLICKKITKYNSQRQFKNIKEDQPKQTEDNIQICQIGWPVISYSFSFKFFSFLTGFPQRIISHSALVPDCRSENPNLTDQLIWISVGFQVQNRLKQDKKKGTISFFFPFWVLGERNHLAISLSRKLHMN